MLKKQLIILCLCTLVGSMAMSLAWESYNDRNGNPVREVDFKIQDNVRQRIMQMEPRIIDIQDSMVGTRITIKGSDQDADRIINRLQQFRSVLCLTSPSGNIYSLSVDDSGTLTQTRNDVRCLQ